MEPLMLLMAMFALCVMAGFWLLRRVLGFLLPGGAVTRAVTLLAWRRHRRRNRAR